MTDGAVSTAVCWPMVDLAATRCPALSRFVWTGLPKSCRALAPFDARPLVKAAVATIDDPARNPC
jgi:hypothetical protein